MENAKNLYNELLSTQVQLRKAKAFFKNLSVKYIELFKYQYKQMHTLKDQTNILGFMGYIFSSTIGATARQSSYYKFCSESFVEMHAKLKKAGNSLKRTISKFNGDLYRLNNELVKKKIGGEFSFKEEYNYYEAFNDEILKEIYTYSKEIAVQCYNFVCKISGTWVKSEEKN